MPRSIPKCTDAGPRAAAARSRRSANAAPAFLAVAALVILLSSCVDTKVDMAISRDGSGRLKATYGVSGMLSALQGYEGASDLAMLPLDRAAADSRSRDAPGTAIVSFSSRRDSEALVIGLEMTFASPQALLAFIDPSGKRFHYTSSATGQSIRATLAPGQGQGGMDPDLVAYIDTAFPGATLSIAIAFPGAVKVAGIGTASPDGRTLTYSSPIPALMESKDPIIWEFRW